MHVMASQIFSFTKCWDIEVYRKVSTIRVDGAESPGPVSLFCSRTIDGNLRSACSILGLGVSWIRARVLCSFSRRRLSLSHSRNTKRRIMAVLTGRNVRTVESRTLKRVHPTRRLKTVDPKDIPRSTQGHTRRAVAKQPCSSF